MCNRLFFLFLVECVEIIIHSSHIDLNLLQELLSWLIFLFLGVFLTQLFDGSIQGSIYFFEKVGGSGKTLVLRTLRIGVSDEFSQIDV